MSASQIRHLARSLGKQDAEKFIERILHGCWSAGNTSLDGHLIDYDTVFALRGRAPQWSYRPNWLSDFFGLEGPGQKKLLKALVSHPINAERVSFREVYRVFDEARQSRLEQRFLDLVGVNTSDFGAPFPAHAEAVSSQESDSPKGGRSRTLDANVEVLDETRFWGVPSTGGQNPLRGRAKMVDPKCATDGMFTEGVPATDCQYPKCATEGAVTEGVPALVKQFQVLSMKMYPNLKATAPWEEDNSSLSVYDLSRFFRFYPILRMSGGVDDETALCLIRNPAGRFKETRESGIPDSVLKPLMKDYVVSSPEQLMELDTQALGFIRDYDVLLSSIERVSPGSSGARIVRAYVINEERTYMNCRPGNDTLVALVQNSESGKIRPEQFSELLRLLVDANDRIPRFDSKGRCQADLRLFLNGYTSNLVAVDGIYQPRLTFFGPQTISETELQPSISIIWEVEIEGKRCPCSIEREDGRTHVIGPRLSLPRLLACQVAPPFFHGGSVICLKPILREDRPPPTE